MKRSKIWNSRRSAITAVVYGRTDFRASEPGTLTLVPVPALGQGVYVAFWVAGFVPYLPLCTGKFARVTGGWVMYAMFDPFVLGSDEPIGYGWVGEGGPDTHVGLALRPTAENGPVITLPSTERLLKRIINGAASYSDCAHRSRSAIP
jgi:hypothetical protein